MTAVAMAAAGWRGGAEAGHGGAGDDDGGLGRTCSSRAHCRSWHYIGRRSYKLKPAPDRRTPGPPGPPAPGPGATAGVASRHGARNRTRASESVPVTVGFKSRRVTVTRASLPVTSLSQPEAAGQPGSLPVSHPGGRLRRGGGGAAAAVTTRDSESNRGRAPAVSVSQCLARDRGPWRPGPGGPGRLSRSRRRLRRNAVPGRPGAGRRRALTEAHAGDRDRDRDHACCRKPGCQAAEPPRLPGMPGAAKEPPPDSDDSGRPGL